MTPPILRAAAFATLALACVAARANVPIPCADTPFGGQVTLGQDVELVVAQPSNNVSAWSLYNQNLGLQAPGVIFESPVETGATFLESARVDLNGDGRDEVLGLFRGTNGDVLVGVYQPVPSPPSGNVLRPVDAWRQSGPFVEAHLVAGDFDGSNDGREEVAVAWRVAAPLALRLRILGGDAAGQIAQANGASLGAWERTTNVQAQPFALAAGDLLLDGRDQIVVANLRSSGGFTIDMNLLEYQTSWTTLLPVGANVAIGSRTDSHVIGTTFDTPGGSPGFSSLLKFTVNAGDVVDSAAAELVLHLQGEGSSNFNFIGQRLFNYRTTRNLANAITGIAFFVQSSRLAQNQVQGGNAGWDAAIGNVDLAPPSEVIVVRGENNPGSTEQFRADVWKVDASGPVPRTYQFRASPTYATFVTVPNSLALTRVSVATGDMQADGYGDVLVAAQEGSAVRRVRFSYAPGNPPTFGGTQVLENFPTSSPTNLDAVAADFDNDSVIANVSNASCRQVDEPSVRNVVWMPPHFEALNADGHAASFGRTTISGGSSTTSFGSFTSSDVSAYLGASVGGTILGIGAEVSARVTAGYSYQATYGEFFETSNEQTLSESFVQSTSGAEALVVNETSRFDCYEYTVSRNGVVATDSGARFCDYDQQGSAGLSGTDAVNWDNPQLVAGRTPAQWFVLQRDWANVALFRPASTNITGANAATITDGQFGTAPTTGTLPAQPFLEVDLGSVQPVTGARIVRGSGPVASLTGYTLYLSAAPFAGAGIPSGPGVSVFAPETADGRVFDGWNVRIRGTNGDPLPTRYVRLQRAGGSGVPSVAELQVFTGAHQEPDRYPENVCDPSPNDNKHRTRVWNRVTQAFVEIDERGDLIWSGSLPPAGCTNHAGVRVAEIWSGVSIGGSSNVEWSLGSVAGTVNGQVRSIESAVRVGAEFDVSGGFVASVQAGGAYEFTRGVTEEVQSQVYWGTGTEMGGSAAGFTNPALFTTCRYRAQPHGLRLFELSNTGYEHGFYVVDYIVDQDGSAWTRASVPPVCRGPLPDAVFQNGFE